MGHASLSVRLLFVSEEISNDQSRFIVTRFSHKHFIQCVCQQRFIKGKSPYSQYVLCCVLMNHYHQHNTNEKRTASVGNTKGRGLCLLCCGPLCLFSCPPQSLLHIKNGHFGCFVNQNQAAHRPPRWAGSQTFMFAENPETLLEYLKG